MPPEPTVDMLLVSKASLKARMLIESGELVRRIDASRILTNYSGDTPEEIVIYKLDPVYSLSELESKSTGALWLATSDIYNEFYVVSNP